MKRRKPNYKLQLLNTIIALIVAEATIVILVIGLVEKLF